MNNNLNNFVNCTALHITRDGNRSDRPSLADKLQTVDFTVTLLQQPAGEEEKALSSSWTIYRVAILVNRVLSLMVKWNLRGVGGVILLECT